MSTVLLKTKLYVPVARLELVPRSHLIDRLNEGLKNAETLTAWDRRFRVLNTHYYFGKKG